MGFFVRMTPAAMLVLGAGVLMWRQMKEAEAE
jgi:hypothetical protein